MPIDVFDYLNHLDQERYRAGIFYAPPEMGTAMTRFAQKVCAQSGGRYLDLLELFIKTHELSAGIDCFSPEKFRDLLIAQSQGAKLLFVDRADFVLDTWGPNKRQNFFRMIATQWDGYKDGMRAKLIVALQTSHEIEAWQITASQAHPRVLKLSDFNDIP